MKNNRNRNNNQPQKIEYTYVFKVKKSYELLDFLLEKLNTSRNNVKSLLSNQQVLVNGSVVRQYNFMLAKEDEVKISKKPITDTPKKNEPKKRPPKINIIYEDEDFFAIDKPQGLLSVESDKEIESAFSYVLKYMQLESKTNRPYVIHRIDKETSGVLVFAKNPIVQSKLRLNWNDFVDTREYIAVVKGHLPKKSDTIICNLMEDSNNMVYVSRSEGQKAITHYEVLQEKDGLSLVKVLIDTGRKNQIRVVLNHLGNPICGDDKYGERDSFKRLMLHSTKLYFKHPFKDKMIQIEAKLPGTFTSLFQKNK